MNIKQEVSKPQEELIEQQMHRTPRAIKYITKTVKTICLDMPVLGLERAVIYPNRIKPNVVQKENRSTKNKAKNNQINKAEETKNVNDEVTINSTPLKTENEVIAELLPELKQMQNLLQDILVKDKPDPRYVRPTLSSKLKETKVMKPHQSILRFSNSHIQRMQKIREMLELSENYKDIK